MLKNLMIKDFIDDLSSKKSVPGGGSCSALTASVAASLCAMALNITYGKKSYESLKAVQKEEYNKALSDSLDIKDEFLKLMDEDGDTFQSVIAAYRLPKSNESEIDKRNRNIEDATKKAMYVPLKTARLSLKLFDDIYVSAKYGSPNVISDAGVAAIDLLASVEGSILNVNINLKSLSDEELKKETRNECEKILNESKKKKEKIIEIVNSKL